MAELRRDPIVGRMVIIAPERAARPHEFVDRPHTERAADCPFCEGNERETPIELAALRDRGTTPNGPGWQVRVVSNKYPAVEPFPVGELFIEGLWNYRASPYASLPGSETFTPSRPARGVHEVIIEAPRHLLATGSLSIDELADVLKVYRDRLLVHRADDRLRFVQIFKNVGEAAGASIEHLHSQLIGTEFVPQAIEEELAGCVNYHIQTERCLFCDLLHSELKADLRVVSATETFMALCPYASRFPYEVWLLPRRHSHRFEDADDRLLAEAARVLRGVLRGIEKLLAASGLASVGYNYVLHSAPFDMPASEHYHWHIEVLPRAVKQAGYEWSTGVHINPVAPEDAAATLRELLRSQQA
jgi:UDPglucose--hexose-1-phosphate uridylyltransferase